jgi:hypothetical protein
MTRLPLLAALVGVLALAACTSAPATYTDDDAKEILFGQATQSSLADLGLTPANNTIQTDSVKNYVAGVTDGSSSIEPAECANSARLLILTDSDKQSTDTFYGLPKLDSAITSISVRARLFASDDAARAFVEDFQKATEACPSFTDAGTPVAVSVSDSVKDGEGFRLDTVAGAGSEATSFRAFVGRSGNLVVAVVGPVALKEQVTLLESASTALFSRLATGKPE